VIKLAGIGYMQDGCDCLHLAAANGHYKVVKLLLLHGADTTRNAVSCSTLAHTHTHPSATTRVGRHQKGKTNLDFTGAGDSEWQWHQLGHMQVYAALQTDNHSSTPPLSFLQAG